MNNRLVETETGELAGAAQLHLTDHGETIHLGLERAQTVGERLGQHGYYLLGEVHRVPAQRRLFVQRGTGAHVVRHISDCHPQAPAAQALFTVHGIVKVARILAVDGDKPEAAQVSAIFLVFLSRLLFQRARFAQYRLGPFVRDAVGADGNVDFQTGVKMVAEHFHDLALGTEVARGVVGDFRRHNLAGLGAALEFWRNQYAVINAAVVRHHETNAALLLIPADNTRRAAVQHLHHTAFRTPAAIQADDAHQHFIAVKHKLHLPGTEVDVIPLLQRDGKTVAVPVALHTATQQVQLVHQAIGAAPIDHQLAIALHGAQPFAQRIYLLLFMQVEVAGDMRVTQGFIRGGEQVEDDFAAGNRVVVACGFALGVGVGNLAFFSHR